MDLERLKDAHRECCPPMKLTNKGACVSGRHTEQMQARLSLQPGRVPADEDKVFEQGEAALSEMSDHGRGVHVRDANAD